MKKILILTTIGPDKRDHGNYQDIYDRINIFRELDQELQIAYFQQKHGIDISSDGTQFVAVETTDKRRIKFDAATGVDSSVQVAAVAGIIDSFQPQIVFGEYFYFSKLITKLKPLFQEIMFCIRCHNFEYRHLKEKYALHNPVSLHERLVRWYNLIQCYSYEKAMVANADLIFCISEYDAELYSKQYNNNDNIQYLPTSMEYEPIYKVVVRSPLNVLYFGSDFRNTYNLEGAQKVIEIAKQMDRERFSFHICGKHLPESLTTDSHVNYHGFVPKLEELLTEMDIAILPNFFGYGMKIKAYELFQRGFPVIVTERIHKAFNGEPGATYLVADRVTDWVNKCNDLQDPELRTRISQNITSFMAIYFNRGRVVETLQEKLNIH